MSPLRDKLRETFHLSLNFYLSLIVIVLACITYGIFYYGILATIIKCGMILTFFLSIPPLESLCFLLTNKLPEINFKRFFQINLLFFIIYLALSFAILFGFTIPIPMILAIFFFGHETFLVILFSYYNFGMDLHHMRTLFWQGHLSVVQMIFAMGNYNIINSLGYSKVKTLFQNKIVTLDKLKTCNQTTINALDNEAIYNDLLYKRISWDEVLPRIMELARQNAIRYTINKPQSTHTASVHESVSKSAKKLSKKFNKQTNVTPEINKLKEQITNFQPNAHISVHQKQVALRSFNKHIDFFDLGSVVSYNQLIALTFVGAKNDDYRQHTFNDYLEAIILAFYEVQRGYNLNEAGIDDMKKDDMPICESGSFNKIVEKMVGILPDCEIKNINYEVIYLQLFSTIKSEIINLFTKPKTIILPKSTASTDDSTLLDEILIKDAYNQQQPLKTKLINNIKVILEKEFKSHLHKVTTDGYTLDQFISDGLDNDETMNCLHDEIKKQQNLKTDGMVSDVSIFGENTSNTDENYNGLNCSPT
ncbi:MAG: hypothetical protein P8L77_06000 [Gammaproteobacteria bacterium]|nr:hypothetical protein [Gammaproteobacteria bacterium]